MPVLGRVSGIRGLGVDIDGRDAGTDAGTGSGIDVGEGVNEDEGSGWGCPTCGWVPVRVAGLGLSGNVDGGVGLERDSP